MATNALGLRSGRRHRPPGGGGPAYGPEMVTTGIGTWSPAGATPPVVDGTGIAFVNANTSTNAQYAVATEDNVTYRIQGVISDYVEGGVTPRVYGATSAHTGIGTPISGNGPFSQEVTTNGVGTPTGQIRFTASVGPTNLKITSVSVKKKLDLNAPVYLLDEDSAFLTDENAAQLTGIPL